MSLRIPCSACGERTPGKLAWVSWAWYLADGKRVAYLQRLCKTCVAANLAPLVLNSNSDPLNCPVCHAEVAVDDLDEVFSTYIIPGFPKENVEFGTDAACAVEVRTRAQLGARLLEDRERQMEGLGPPSLGTQDWGAVGLYPRA